MAKATKDKKKGSDYTAADIVRLEGLEGIRKRPGMYIGGPTLEGLHQLVYEIVSNSIDEALVGRCSAISVTLNDDGSCSVSDDGHGIPVGINPKYKIPAVQMVFCDLHAGGKFENKAYNVSGGLHGIGLKAVNALSEWTEVEVRIDGGLHHQRYERGKVKSDLRALGPTDGHGTKVSFFPDSQIFKDTIEFHYATISSRLRELAFLCKGVTINISDQRGAEPKEDTFHYADGIKEFVAYKNRNKVKIHNEVVYISKQSGDTEIECALQWTDSEAPESFLAYTNLIANRDGGTHLTGLRKGVTRALSKFSTRWLERNGTKKDRMPTGDDFREGLVGVISVKVKVPQFSNQTKDKLLNREVESAVDSAMSESIEIYMEEHPKAAAAIVRRAILAARAREAAKKAREVVRKSAMAVGGLPGKLADCQSKKSEECEVYLVEGDSAGGTAKQGRDRRIQAILPLRGKILNVEKAQVAKMLQHEEIRTIITALGAGFGRDEFNLEKLRYSKVIIMTDADVDGSHIRTLLLTFFFRQMPELVASGHVYIAQPPLYHVKKGKKEEYVLSDKQMNDTLMRLGLSGSSLSSIGNNGKSAVKDLSGAKLRELLELLVKLEEYSILVRKKGLDFGRYISQWNKKSGSLPMYVIVLDGEVHYFHSDDELMKFSAQQTKARKGDFVLVTEEDYYSGRKSDGALQVEIHLAPKIGEAIKKLQVRGFEPQDWAAGEDTKMRFSITNNDESHEVKCLYDALEKVRELGGTGLTIKRFKGLGEMNAEELWETTMNPDNRTLLQVTLEDEEAASDIFTILMGDQVEPRREFIEKYALDVKNLDI